jgi:DNA invertase Pin-like site-specific DNA recombinase
MEGWMIVGYARVSTDGQTLDAQEVALKAAGAGRVFAEKISGAITDRKALSQGNRSPWPWGYLDRNPPR